MRQRLIPLYILYLILALISQSCVSFVGLTDGYKALSKSNKAQVSTLKDHSPTNRVESDGRKTVFLVSAEDVIDLIKRSNKEYQIVYSYNPHCSSDRCIPIDNFVSICEDYKAEPIILSRYLDDILFDQNLPNDIHIYAMDSKKYGSRFVYKYAPRFLSELTGQEIEEDAKVFFLFRNGVFIGKGDAKEISDWVGYKKR